jgi:hypothetical protein
MHRSLHGVPGFALVVLPLLGACAPAISVRVLQPAMVSMPPEVKTLAIVDRAGAQGAGEQVLSAIEGALTGESIMGDREGAKRALETFVTVVEEGPRFEVVRPSLSKEQTDSGIWDDELGWGKVRKICEASHADALVALEVFDSDSNMIINPSTLADGTVQFNAKRDSYVLTAWRVYYPKDKLILDDVRDRKYTQSWTGEGSTREAAIGAIPGANDSIIGLGANAGDAYGRRISPNFQWVRRAYYKKGNDQLKRVGREFEAQDYDGAGADLRTLVSDDTLDMKTRGKAEFDMALYYETMGDLESALVWSKKAAVDLGNKKSRGYVQIISQRLADQKLLEEQMKIAPDAPPPVRAGTTNTTPPAGGRAQDGSRGTSSDRPRPTSAP